MKMEGKALISVIVPLYNKAAWLDRCIQSIIDQTYQNIEILIINDGSTDRSRDVAENIDDPRIKIFDKLNGGVSSARNVGIEKAKGEYIAFIDADDEWNMQHLEVLIEGFCKYDDVVLVCDDYVEVYSNDMKDSVRRNLPFEIVDAKIGYHLIEDYLKTLKDGHFLLSGSSVLIKLSEIKENKLKFSVQLEHGEDINYWLRLSQFGKFVFCDYIGLLYHRVDDQSAMNKNRQKAQLVSHFFDTIDVEKYNEKGRTNVKKFLTREYFKKAYQNRGLELKREELSTSVGGEIQISRLKILPYLSIRYCPKFVFSIYKSLRK